MLETSQDSIQPLVSTLDVRHFKAGSLAERERFAKDLGQAFSNIGFVVITGHSISAEQQAQVYQEVAKFFALDTATKERYELRGKGGARGYTSFGKEHAKDSNVGDLKEFFHYGMDLPAGHRLEAEYPPNVLVEELPAFNANLRRLYRDLLDLGVDILKAISIYLGLEEDFFDDKVRFGNSILRPIHYPPLTGKEEPGAIRSAAHEDINLITLLIGASSPGLQVKTLAGEWHSVTTKPNEIVINVGDMLQRLTNRRLVSTTHRVVNPPAAMATSTRFSIPFFLHPVSEMDLSALPHCVPPGSSPVDPPITAGDYLDQRLREIGLK